MQMESTRAELPDPPPLRRDAADPEPPRGPDPRDVPETPPDEPRPTPVQDPPAEPDPAPYVVRTPVIRSQNHD
jgi:hypothetical protein